MIIESNPLVTIGVASYNNEKFIIETLNSIVSQTYKNIEIIIVDDCSKDNSVEIIKQFIATQSNVKFTLHELKENKGIPHVCNTMLNNAKGKYLNIFSSDDIMKEDKIDKLVKFLENTNDSIAGCFSIVELIDEKSDLLYLPKMPSIPINDKTKESLFCQIADSNVINTLSTLLKINQVKDVGGFNEEYCYEDYDLWFRILYKYELKFVPHLTVQYRRHSSQLTSSKFSSNVTYDKFRILIYHREKSKLYSEAFKNGLRRCLRAFIQYDTIEYRIVLLYVAYFRKYWDYRAIVLLLFYLIKKRIK